MFYSLFGRDESDTEGTIKEVDGSRYEPHIQNMIKMIFNLDLEVRGIWKHIERGFPANATVQRQLEYWTVDALVVYEANPDLERGYIKNTPSSPPSTRAVYLPGQEQEERRLGWRDWETYRNFMLPKRIGGEIQKQARGSGTVIPKRV